MEKKVRKNIIKVLSIIAIVICIPAFKANAITITPVRQEISGDPGQKIVQNMTIINDKDTEITYFSSFANFEAKGETGSPSFDDGKTGFATWMSAVPDVTLKPGESKTIPIVISIPMDAEPGGHFGGVFWGDTPTAGDGQISVGTKTGMLVILSVSGDIVEKGGVIEFGTDGKKSFFTALPIKLFYRFQNEGNDRIKPQGNMVIRGTLGLKKADLPGNPQSGNVLPKSIRKFEISWLGKNANQEEMPTSGFFKKAGYELRHFAFGHYSAKINLTYGTDNRETQEVTRFWVIPWHALLLILLGLLIIWTVAKNVFRKYSNWVIKQAERRLIRMEKSRERRINSDRR